MESRSQLTRRVRTPRRPVLRHDGLDRDHVDPATLQILAIMQTASNAEKMEFAKMRAHGRVQHSRQMATPSRKAVRSGPRNREQVRHGRRLPLLRRRGFQR